MLPAFFRRNICFSPSVKAKIFDNYHFSNNPYNQKINNLRINRRGHWLVKIEISDDVWERYKLSWALMDIREHKDLVKMLEDDLLEKSNSVIEDSERQLMDDKSPEALARREIGLMKEEIERGKQKQKSLDLF